MLVIGESNIVTLLGLEGTKSMSTRTTDSGLLLRSRIGVNGPILPRL